MFNRCSFGQPGVIYILSIIAFSFLIFLARKEYQQSTELLRPYLVTGLLFKILCGIGLGMLYEYYYSNGDTYAYFKDGSTIANVAFSDPVQFLKLLWSGGENADIKALIINTQPRALFFSKLTAIGYLISFGNYWGVAILFSFISFYSAWKLVGMLVRFYPGMRIAAIISFLFFPSAIFWSSGLMKESIAMAGLFAIVGAFIRVWNERKISLLEGLAVVIGFWLLWNLKYYYAGVLLVALGGISIVRVLIAVRPVQSQLAIVIIFLAVLVIPLLLVTELHPNFDSSRIFGVIVKNYNAYRVISKPENLISYYHLEDNPFSMIINMPWALTSGLFQPFIWNAKSFFQFIAGIETFAVFILFIGALKKGRPILNSADFLLLTGAILYIAILAIFLALSTPNIGTLVRYRVGFYPFLLVILLQANPWLFRRGRFTGR